jgi:SAM-dependent methyltransferase
MMQAKGKTVLELAAASGENLMLLAYAGATVTYYNEIDPKENSNFRQIRAALEPEIQAKLQDLSGDCFDVLKKKPNIARTIDILLCQNLVHFFNTQKQAEFFQLLKKLLKPGGQVVLTANSLYGLRKQGKEIFVKDPQSCAITNVNYVAVNHLFGSAPCKIFFQAQFASSPNAVTGFDYENIVVYEKKLTDKSWKKHERNIKKTDLELRSQIEKANKEFEAQDMQLIPAGRVRYVKSTQMSFTLTTLTKLLEAHGFDVETTFVSTLDGHRIANPAADLFKDGQQMGIIAKYNPK